MKMDGGHYHTVADTLAKAGGLDWAWNTGLKVCRVAGVEGGAALKSKTSTSWKSTRERDHHSNNNPASWHFVGLAVLIMFLCA